MDGIKYMSSLFFHQHLMVTTTLISAIAAVDYMDGGEQNLGAINIPCTYKSSSTIFFQKSWTETYT